MMTNYILGIGIGLIVLASTVGFALYWLERTGKRYRIILTRFGHDNEVKEHWYVKCSRFGILWTNTISDGGGHRDTWFETAEAAGDWYRGLVTGFSEDTVMYPLREIKHPTQVPSTVSSLRFVAEAGFDPEQEPNPKRKHAHLPQPPSPNSTQEMRVFGKLPQPDDED